MGRAYHGNRSIFPRIRNRYSKLPGRSDYFSATLYRRNVKKRAFIYGVLSGAVEPVAAVFTVWAASLIVPLLPYFLSFAAGAMFYVVVEELIPEMSAGKHSNYWNDIIFLWVYTNAERLM